VGKCKNDKIKKNFFKDVEMAHEYMKKKKIRIKNDQGNATQNPKDTSPHPS
jgi:hypothetical protein